jgi:hypothetical protein
MPSDYSFIADNPQGNPINQMNGMLGVARGIQGVQSNAIELQKANQLNQDRVALQQFTSNPDNWQTNGKIDMDKINKVVPQIAPLAGPDYVARMTTLGTAQTQATEAKTNLTTQQRGIYASAIGALGYAGIKDPSVYSQVIGKIKDQYSDNPDMVKLGSSYQTTLGMAEPGDNVPKTAIQASQALMAPASQQAALAPSAQMLNVGGETKPVIVQPAVGGNQPSITVPGSQPNAPIQNTLPPTAQKINPETGATEYIGSTGKGSGPVQTSLGAGQQQAFTSLVSQPLAANDYLVNSSPLLHNNVDSIDAALKEGDITTGTAGPLTAKVLSAFGVASDTAEQRASAYDLLGKRLAQNAQQLAQGFGPNTNAGLEQTTKGWGTEKYNHTAIETLNKQVGALITLKDGYAKGVQIAGQIGPKAIQQFDTQFGANSNIADSLFLTSANRGDLKGMQEAASEVGYKTPQGQQFNPKLFLQSPQYQLMRHRLSNLNQLETNGRL